MTAADNDQQRIRSIDLDQDGQLAAALHPIVRRLRTDIIMMQHIAAAFDLGHGILRHLQLRRTAANGTQRRAIGIDDHFPVGPGVLPRASAIVATAKSRPACRASSCACSKSSVYMHESSVLSGAAGF